jgi:hypothetical protein
MSAIRTFFVRAHHWQVFALLIGLSCIAEGGVMWTYPRSVSLIPAEFCWICFVVWFWSLGSFLCSVVQPNLRLSLPFFRFALVYPLVYMGVFQVIPFERLTLATASLYFHFIYLPCIACFLTSIL